MTEPETSQFDLGRLPVYLQWSVLVVASIILVVLFEQIDLPATLLLAPMVAGIGAGVMGATIRVHRYAFAAGQAILGVLVAASISPQLVSSFLEHWALFLFVVLSTILASSVSGYAISRLRIMPGTTAVWGSAPGAAAAMVIMAEAFGADTRLVAFMQYLRVVIVTIVAALVASLFVDTSGVAAEEVIWFPTIDAPALAATFGVAIAGSFLAKLIRLPSPFLLGAMLLGIGLEFSTAITFQLPQWLFAIAYPLIGWSIGLRFNRVIVRQVTRALPKIAFAIFLLVGLCCGLAALLVVFADIDPLTAYLAASPGGMDSVAIIAAASPNVDLSFVMGVQMLRFLLVLLFGPALARGVARLVRRAEERSA